MIKDCQWVASQVESWTTQGVSYCVVQPCLLICGEQVWSTDTVVNVEGDGHVSSCRWTRSGEGRALGLDRETRVTG
jgi:ribosomal protein S9